MDAGAAHAAETDDQSDIEPNAADDDFIDDECRTEPATFYNAMENGKQRHSDVLCLLFCFPVGYQILNMWCADVQRNTSVWKQSEQE